MVFIRNRQSMIEEYIAGFCRTNPGVTKVEGQPIVLQSEQDGDLVPIVSGGGSGHEPAHVGFVGQGMLTAAVYGEIFIPPTAEEVLASIRAVNRGKGVFLIVKNFEADLASFGQAIDLARQEGIAVKYIVSHDDISVDTKDNFRMRHRGLAGTILLHKILGAAALAGYSLDELEQLGLSLATEIATIGFATKSARLPDAALPLFDLEEGEISYGIGIHGEEGYRTVRFESSEQLANEIVNKLKLKFRWKEGEDYILLVNNLGSISELEQGIFLNDICQFLELEGLKLSFIKTGKWMTSLDMGGISVTLCRVKDPVWLDFLEAPTAAAAW
ncbi:DhaKLM operon coactivator DhaQ [Streptococcus suis]|uniref:DhaKLM operon coactivator DhaQ n=1 Tax=Streptococcus suis TaxID=1307 RepID=UPI000CF57AE5|nr:DhaKLM operon coactivator DhaQ [Streptococcus suis]HEM5984948.1 DhaKLM operon coactivator DhaQ [Streptococcus suis]HEM5989135.1 DhaKLM operon coactivator DhaQ [Streptococcus suis]HEM5996677.1 DhaKLM operon coactivator DhaQ [Streptococcus suis]HEM6081784.1 DhaKLM operon coactivator DhaQ [Streptococcus suis]HEM6088699.1 DhaKLM operon coactivator DhaQ [Streptococcus suis]